MYVGVGRVGSAEGVAFVCQSFSRVREVGNEVGDVAFGDVVSVGSQEDAAEMGLPSATGGGLLLEASKRLLRLAGEGVPVRLSEVGEGSVGGFHHSCGETPPEADEDGEVVGVKGSEGGPVKV